MCNTLCTMHEIVRLVITIIWIPSQLIQFYFTFFYEVARQLEMFSGVGSEGNGKCIAHSEVYVQMKIRVNFRCSLYFCMLLRQTSIEFFVKHL